jgi:hypothetical protein
MKFNYRYKFIRGFVLKVMYPLYMLLAAFMPAKKEALQAAIISMNNGLIERAQLNTKKLLLLMPHCLQVDKCEIRITTDVHKCKGCGRCEIKNLVSIADKHGLELHVATGGNLARRVVMDVRPEAIIAVACERDLSSGIADVFPMPVYGVSNERPFGPCINTTVDISKVEDAIVMLSGASTESTAATSA